MSALKEEWASLMKLRESGYVDEGKKQEIRSRIFSNFNFVKQEYQREAVKPEKVLIKKDYEDMRQEFLNTVRSDIRKEAYDCTKNFEFGLRSITPPPTIHKQNRVSIKSEEIWNLSDKPESQAFEEKMLDQFEINSIAKNQYNILSFNDKEIKILSDLSPVTRYLSNIVRKEEESYLKESKGHNVPIFRLFHLVHSGITADDLEKLEWNSVKNICCGLVFKTEICDIFHIPDLVANNNLNAIENNKFFPQNLSEPRILLDNSLAKRTIKNSTSTIPLVHYSNDISVIERDLIEVVEKIRGEKSSEIDEERLGWLLEKTGKILVENGDVSAGRLRGLYQTLSEYKNMRRVNKVEKRTQRKGFQTQIRQKVSVIKEKMSSKNSVASSFSSSKSSKWIGGNKYQAEFEDDDWMNVVQEKKKKESRNEQLYKLSFKPKK